MVDCYCEQTPKIQIAQDWRGAVGKLAVLTLGAAMQPLPIRKVYGYRNACFDILSRRGREAFHKNNFLETDLKKIERISSLLACIVISTLIEYIWAPISGYLK